jgi:protein ImuB
MRVVCIYLHRERNLTALAEVFYRFTPQIMVSGSRALFLEVSKCRGLYSEERLLKWTRLTLQRLNVGAQVAVADDVPTALSFAFFKMVDKNLLPIEALRFFADPLSESPQETRATQDMITNLRRLGVCTLLECSRLSVREVSSRFGSLGLTALFRVLGQCQVVWRHFVPSERFVEKYEFDLEYPAESLEPILFRLRGMLDHLFLRMRGRGRRARKIEIVLRQEYGLLPDERDYKVVVVLQLPFVSVNTVFQISKERLEAEVRARPFRHRVVEIEVAVAEEAPDSPGQRDILDQKREENEESFFSLVSRLATRLGVEKVFFAQPTESHWPEKTWAKASECKERDDAFLDPLPERPLRLLTSPERLQLSGSKIMTGSFQDSIQEIDRQEVIFTYWWEGHEERIYYRLKTGSGRHLWVFRQRSEHYLHGIFD